MRMLLKEIRLLSNAGSGGKIIEKGGYMQFTLSWKFFSLELRIKRLMFVMVRNTNNC